MTGAVLCAEGLQEARVDIVAGATRCGRRIARESSGGAACRHGGQETRGRCGRAAGGGAQW
jgi:hypothetical protein